jgi:hypothetical protein
MRRLAAPLALLVIAAVPAEASADVRYRGKSGQERLVTLRTGDDGVPKRFGINWRADCRRPGFVFTSSTTFLPAFDSAARTRFVDEDRYRVRDEGSSLRAVFDGRVAGNRVSPRRWRGVFRISVRILRGGTLLDRCYLRTRWHVLPQS